MPTLNLAVDRRKVPAFYEHEAPLGVGCPQEVS